jgi:hypothetical protein
VRLCCPGDLFGRTIDGRKNAQPPGYLAAAQPPVSGVVR